MPSLKALKNRIASVKSTQKINQSLFLPPFTGEVARRADGGLPRSQLSAALAVNRVTPLRPLRGHLPRKRGRNGRGA